MTACSTRRSPGVTSASVRALTISRGRVNRSQRPLAASRIMTRGRTSGWIPSFFILGSGTVFAGWQQKQSFYLAGTFRGGVCCALITMTLAERGKVGLFGIGLAAYWPQFKGLKRRLEGYQRIVNGHLDQFCDVVDAGMVDSAPGAAATGDLFAREGVELIICYVATYATSSQVLPAVQKTSAPVLILNLQPVSGLDYPRTDTGEWLANCCSCCVPEIACAFARSRIDFHVVTGVLGVERGRFCEALPSHPDAQRAWQ